MPENQNANQIAKCPTECPTAGRRSRLSDEILSRLMERYVITVGDPPVKTALKGDAEIAKEISEETGAEVSQYIIFRYRKKYGIESCNGRGGARPGAGNPKIDRGLLADLMDRFTFEAYVCGSSMTTRKIAKKEDHEIADEISRITGIEISHDLICRYRLENGIESCNRRGGLRPGAGRPSRTSTSPKKRTMHKLTISDSAFVQACSSVYDFEPGIWNQWTWKYEKLPRYVPKIRQDGLRTYTPVLPFPDVYTKGQKYSALKGF